MQEPNQRLSYVFIALHGCPLIGMEIRRPIVHFLWFEITAKHKRQALVEDKLNCMFMNKITFLRSPPRYGSEQG